MDCTNLRRPFCLHKRPQLKGELLVAWVIVGPPFLPVPQADIPSYLAGFKRLLFAGLFQTSTPSGAGSHGGARHSARWLLLLCSVLKSFSYPV